MKSIFYFLLIVAAALAAIPLVPLHTAVNLLQLKRVGFEAAQIEGNLWEGHMYDVHLAGIEMGDVASKMSLADIKDGRIKLQLTGSEEATAALKGGFSFGLGGIGIDDFNVAIPVMAGPPPIGGVTLILDGLHVKFPNGECADGRGEVRAYLSGALPALGLPGEMTGPATCREGKLVFDLESSSGREQEEVTILSMNKFKIRLFIKPNSPRLTELLTSKGFRPEFDGYAYAEERTLGGGVSPLGAEGSGASPLGSEGP